MTDSTDDRVKKKFDLTGQTLDREQMGYAASVDLNDRNYMYCLKESRYITSELVGIKWQKVHFINFIQREVTVTHFKTGPLMRFFVPESNQDREIIFAL